MKPLALLLAAACTWAALPFPAAANNLIGGVVYLPSQNLGGGGVNQTLVDVDGDESGGQFETAYSAGGTLYANFLTGHIKYKLYADNASSGLDLQLLAEYRIQGAPTGTATVPVTFEFAVHGVGNVNYIAQGYSVASMTARMRSQTAGLQDSQSSYVYQWEIDGRGLGALESWVHQPTGTVIINHEARGEYDIILRTTEHLAVQSNGLSPVVNLSYQILGYASGIEGSASLNGMNTGQLSVILPDGYTAAAGTTFLSSPVPEPATAAQAALGLAALLIAAAVRRRA
jgi:MYXO-CTERM domain-containing protein